MFEHLLQLLNITKMLLLLIVLVERLIMMQIGGFCVVGRMLHYRLHAADQLLVAHYWQSSASSFVYCLEGLRPSHSETDFSKPLTHAAG